MNSKKLLSCSVDLLTCLLAAFLASLAYHSFSNCNHFAPGGISGIAYVVSRLSGLHMSLLLIIFNLPFFLLIAILIHRRTGVMLTIYNLANSGILLLLDRMDLPCYITDSNLIFACISAGILTGAASFLMLRRFGASGGTYSISALVHKWHPSANMAWLSFAMDASVVLLIFFAFGRQFEAALCTLVNLFLANYVVDFLLSGMKSGYKFEIITTEAEAISAMLLRTLGRGVTKLDAEGMYSHEGREVLICIIRKRQLGAMMRILRSYPGTFSSFTKVSEIFGRFI